MLRRLSLSYAVAVTRLRSINHEQRVERGAPARITTTYYLDLLPFPLALSLISSAGEGNVDKDNANGKPSR